MQIALCKSNNGYRLEIFVIFVNVNTHNVFLFLPFVLFERIVFNVFFNTKCTNLSNNIFLRQHTLSVYGLLWFCIC